MVRGSVDSVAIQSRWELGLGKLCDLCVKKGLGLEFLVTA